MIPGLNLEFILNLDSKLDFDSNFETLSSTLFAVIETC